MNDGDDNSATPSEWALLVMFHFHKVLQMGFCIRLPLICICFKKKDNILMGKKANVRQLRFSGDHISFSHRRHLCSFPPSLALVEQLWFITFFFFHGRCSQCDQKKTKKTKTNKFSTAMSWKWLDGNYVLENKPAVFNMQIILLADLKLIAYQWKWRNDNISLRDRIFCWQCGNPASGTEEALPASCRCSRRSFSERLHKRRLVWMRQQSVNSWSSTNC